MNNTDAGSGLATSSKLRGPLVRQFIVYLENRVGVLLDFTRMLGQNGIHICGISIVDTADAAVVRVIVDDPDRCSVILREHGIPSTENPVLVVRLKQGPEQLESVLRALVEAEVNLDYVYSLLIYSRGHTLLAIHCEDPGYTRFAIEQMGLEVLTQADLSR